MARKSQSSGNDDIVIAGENGGIGSLDGSGSGTTAIDAAGVIVIDPADFDAGTGGHDSGSDTAEQPRKRRGRKPGSRNAAKAKGSLDINGLEAILLSGHAMLASITRVQEMALDEMEAKALATAASRVAAHYDLSTTQKSLDLANLIMCIGTIYGQRIFSYRLRTNAEKKKARDARAAAEVHNFGMTGGNMNVL